MLLLSDGSEVTQWSILQNLFMELCRHEHLQAWDLE